MKPDVSQPLRSIAVLATAALGVALISIGLLYNVSVHQQGLRLLGMVREQARIIEAMAAHEMQRPAGDTSRAVQDDAFVAVMSQLRAAQNKLAGLGQTGELYVARREGDSIVYLLAHRGQSLVHPARMVFGGESGEPMYRALTGRSGAGILRDYRGAKVLAAYEPVKVFGLGMVAALDLSEVRAPFLKADLIVLVATLVFTIVGGLLLLVVSAPARRRLRENSEFTRRILAASPDCIEVLDLEGRLLFISDAGRQLLEIDDPQTVLNTSWPDFWQGSDHEAALRAIAAAKAGGSGMLEGFCPSRKGTPRWWNVVIQPMAGSDGKPERLLATSRDITERKRTEEEKERLAREVERRKVELEQLIYAASHDLRTPMVGVQGFVGELRRSLKDLLAELSRPDLPPEFRQRMTELTGAEIPESLKFIDAGVKRMNGLITGLLRLSRLGRAEFQAELLDMNRVVGEVVRSLEFAAREAGAKVEVSDLPAALGDRMQMGQAFSNLVENAFKYRSPDREPVIRITGRRDGGMAVYTVEDNGIGIAPEQQQRVFIPFFRADGRTDGGEGLGLTIVSRIVERLGGRVWVESEPGKGSRFYVALPTG
jgi:PAS domain S-box-containing protein